MAVLNITEFKWMASDHRGDPVAVGVMDELDVASQNVTYTTAASSNALAKSTRFVRLIADADCYVAMGSSPTATATSTRLEANVAEYFGVQRSNTNQTDILISAYDGAS